MQRRTSACSSVVHPSVYAVLLIFITIALSSSSIAYGQPLQDQERAIELITSTADKICGEALTGGEAKSSGLQGNVQAQLRGLASKLADAGISGSGRLTSEQYKNVIREDLAANLRDIRACKLKIVDTLKDALLGKPDPPPTPPTPGTKLGQPMPNGARLAIATTLKTANDNKNMTVKNYSYTPITFSIRTDDWSLPDGTIDAHNDRSLSIPLNTDINVTATGPCGDDEQHFRTLQGYAYDLYYKCVQTHK